MAKKYDFSEIPKLERCEKRLLKYNGIEITIVRKYFEVSNGFPQSVEIIFTALDFINKDISRLRCWCSPNDVERREEQLFYEYNTKIIRQILRRRPLKYKSRLD